MRAFILSLLLPLLASCGTLGSIRQGVDDTRRLIAENRENVTATVANLQEVVAFVKGGLEQLKAFQEELKAANKEAFEKADKDKDGKLSVSELIAYILAGGMSAMEIARRALRAAVAKAMEQHVENEHAEPASQAQAQ